MILKERTKSLTHRVLESLNFRMNLPVEEQLKYENQVKGWAGEKQFDFYMGQFNQSGYVLNDLVLHYKDTVFQIDSLFIANDSIYLYEVKNYTGSYFYKENFFSQNQAIKFLTH
ncbi:NERD domain-containing protein [Carnobacterium viridans]|uniref:nuclease-related domain-containing protein n=1 Tax=Carnobacterium viridans TaxID=174587 RepID=UPI000B178CCB|nr:nuclease-related domain-containing protein [Carnobacterium viridans]UDE94765.1 NERD domain-containing protein [Carnobacterium viridans]